MKRKVIQIGESTQLISIPRAWSLANGVKKGDELEVHADSNQLTVTTGNIGNKQSTTLDLAAQKTLRRRSICAAYLRGYHEVEIHYKSPDYIRVVQGVLPEFTGYEIVRQGKTSCLVKQISLPQPGEFESVYNRLFLLLHDTGTYIAEAVEKEDIEMLQSIPYREVNINKFANFCRRLINNRSIASTKDATVHYFILSHLEFLGDEYKALAKHLVESKEINKQIKSLIDRSSLLLEGVYKLHSKYRKEIAEKNAILYDSLAKDLREAIEAKKISPYMFHYMSRIIEIIVLMQESMLQLGV